MPDEVVRCRTCQFFDLFFTTAGICRAHPPRITARSDGGVTTEWPEVDAADDWCGEYTKRASHG